jgi:EAL domain-containing protein (putative c-di-GMP-specific phosphodiesterase class I)
LDSGKLIGLQALLRWQHPVMGLLPADDFIPAAAETEMLAALGDWLFNRIANDVRHWQRRGKRCLPVHVRCDCRMLSDEPFFAMLLDSRQRYNLHPDLLAVELGERTFVESNGQLLASLVQLEQLGMGVGVSDFGAEPTLPSHLHQTPVRTVVLSRQLCRGDGDQIPSLRLIGALIAFCHALGITVVADGVDHEEQRGLLARLGCDQVQGSLLLTAVSGEEVEDLLEPA